MFLPIIIELMFELINESESYYFDKNAFTQ